MQTREKYTDSGYHGAARLPSFSGDSMDARSYFAFMREVMTVAREKTAEGGVCAVFIDLRNGIECHPEYFEMAKRRMAEVLGGKQGDKEGNCENH